MPRHVSLGPAGATQSDRRHAAEPRSNLVPDWGYRAYRIQLHVPRTGALRGSCGVDRCIHGADVGAGRPSRLRVLRGTVRLHPQPGQGTEALAVAAGGAGLLRCLLRRVPLGDSALRPQDAGPRGSCRFFGQARATSRRAGLAFLVALGGAGNLREIGACTTRLRLVVAEQGLIDEAELRALGAKESSGLRPMACRSCLARSRMPWQMKSAMPRAADQALRRPPCPRRKRRLAPARSIHCDCPQGCEMR
ncbi:PTS transporter subunit EIIB [Novosphingobium resinovorum]